MAQGTSYYYYGTSNLNESFELGFITSTTRVVVDANDGNDVVRFSFTVGNSYATGGRGKDFVSGGDGHDVLFGDLYATDEFSGASIELSAATDVLVGNGGNDVLFAGGGSNFADGSSGDDVIYGGAGNEMLVGGLGDDMIFGLGGNDRIFGGTSSATDMKAFIDTNFGTIQLSHNGASGATEPSSFTATSAAGIVATLSNTGNDYIDGGAGNDYIDGQDGADKLLGGAGLDEIYGGAGNDYIEGGADNDLIRGDAGSDNIYGGSGNDNIDGGTETDGLFGDDGDDGDDFIVGGAGNAYDFLDGGAGNDFLYGGGGSDGLVGGAGIDSFYFYLGTVAEGNDYVVDFTHGVDRLYLDDFSGLGQLQLGYNFTVNTSAVQNVATIIYDTNGNLYFDSDGTGAGSAVQFATFENRPTLTVGDFFVI